MGASLDAVRLLGFVLLTLGHCALVAACLRRHAHARLRDLDEYAYFAVLLGFGSLQSVLHLLATIAGISLLSGAATLAIIDLVLGAWLLHRHRSTSVRESGRGLSIPDARLPSLAIPGIVAILALGFQWYSVAAVSLRVAGPDAAHYHVPYAVNYSHGTNLFGFVATPHLYPMGTSIWASWLLQPLPGPALLALTTLPAALLIVVSVGLLFRAAIGESGIVWAPWLVLWLLTAPLLRFTLLPSADFLYAAAFIAVFVQGFVIWRSATVRGIDLLGAGVAGGLLLGTKTTGAPSLLLILAVWAALIWVRRLMARRPLTWDAHPAALAAAAIALVFAGGIWLIRNWIVFGSPLAPSGLSLFGVAIFPGDAYLEGGYYYSVLRDLRDLEGYRLAERFAVYTKRLIGPWFMTASLGLLILGVDAVFDWRDGRRLSEATASKLALIATTALLAVAHAALLIPAPWTSLEWTRGLSLRYVLPLLMLYVMVMALSLFPAGLTQWHKIERLRWGVGLVLMGWIALQYVTDRAVPGLPQAEWFPVFEPRFVVLSIMLVLLWLTPRPVRAQGRVAAAIVTIGALALLSSQIAARNEQLMAGPRVPSQSAPAAAPESDYRCLYNRALGSEREEPEQGRRRFFVASRFDAPLELQGPDFDNLVFDARGRTERPTLLQKRGPGSGPRDYIIIDAREHEGESSPRLAFQIGVRAGLRHIGDCGGYQVYRAGAPAAPTQ
jgi:hypothetical protein